MDSISHTFSSVWLLSEGNLSDERMMDVRDLTSRMRSMDESAYRDFFNCYYKRLGAYLTTMSNGDLHRVEDALQMTLVRVPKYIRVFDTEDVFWSWLTRLAKSAYIDSYRKESVFCRLKKRFWNERIREGDSVERSGTSERLERMEQSIGSLGEEDQRLLRLKYYDGCSVRDIAGKMGVTEKAIESRLTRVRGRLRSLLRKGEEAL